MHGKLPRRRPKEALLCVSRRWQPPWGPAGKTVTPGPPSQCIFRMQQRTGARAYNGASNGTYAVCYALGWTWHSRWLDQLAGSASAAPWRVHNKIVRLMVWGVPRIGWKWVWAPAEIPSQ